jgi:hypothetical protein
MNSFLPQAGIVERLLNASIRALHEMPEGETKAMLQTAIEPFGSAITPSVIFLDEVYDYANSQAIEITEEQAISILETAASDIDTNYVTDAVIYHVDEFISGK